MNQDQTPPIDEDELQRLIDGRLPPERQAALEQRLADEPATMARVAAYRAQRAALRDGLRLEAGEPAPARLRLARLARSTAPTAGAAATRRERLGRIAAVLALVATGGFSGWIGRGLVAEPDAARLQPAIAVGAHRVFVADGRRPVELRAEASEQLVQWLSNRLGRPVTIPDLAAAGLRFMGGRLIATPGGAAAQLMYDDVVGRRVTLFLEPESGVPHAPVLREVQGIAALSWGDERFVYTVAMQDGQKQVASIGSLVRQQMPPGNRTL